MKTLHLLIAIIVLGTPLCLTPTTAAQPLHVDNRTGNDETGDGSKEAPFASIQRAVDAWTESGEIIIAEGSGPYHEKVEVRRLRSPEDRPAILNGNGVVVSGMIERKPEEWASEEDGTFSIRLRNNAWGMHHHWEGEFDLVRIDGKPATNVTSREELEANSYFLYKNREEAREDPLHNTLFIRLPEGQSPADLRIETVSELGGISIVGCENLIVRDLITEFSSRDGFSTTRGHGLVIERVEGRFHMDQGISHHGSGSTVRNSWFHSNAGCGIVDVYPESIVHYEYCLIEKDFWRGGVEFHRGKFSMDSCVVVDNAKRAVAGQRESQVSIVNCLLIGDASGESTGLFASGGSQVTVTNSTLLGFSSALNLRNGGSSSRLEVSNSAVLQSPVVWSVRIPRDAEEPERFSDTKNLYQAGVLEFEFRGEEGTERNQFDHDSWAEYLEWSGNDTGSAMIEASKETDWESLFSLQLPDGTPVGARIDREILVGATGFQVPLVPKKIPAF